MHLKLDPTGGIDDGDVARDLGQDTADIVVLSAADSDLASFHAAHAILPKDFPSLRLTNLLALGHPASVDLYVERTLAKAKINIEYAYLATSPSSETGLAVIRVSDTKKAAKLLMGIK